MDLMAVYRDFAEKEVAFFAILKNKVDKNALYEEAETDSEKVEAMVFVALGALDDLEADELEEIKKIFGDDIEYYIEDPFDLAHCLLDFYLSVYEETRQNKDKKIAQDFFEGFLSDYPEGLFEAGNFVSARKIFSRLDDVFSGDEIYNIVANYLPGQPSKLYFYYMLASCFYSDNFENDQRTKDPVYLEKAEKYCRWCILSYLDGKKADNFSEEYIPSMLAGFPGLSDLQPKYEAFKQEIEPPNIPQMDEDDEIPLQDEEQPQQKKWGLKFFKSFTSKKALREMNEKPAYNIDELRDYADALPPPPPPPGRDDLLKMLGEIRDKYKAATFWWRYRLTFGLIHGKEGRAKADNFIQECEQQGRDFNNLFAIMRNYMNGNKGGNNIDDYHSFWGYMRRKLVKRHQLGIEGDLLAREEKERGRVTNDIIEGLENYYKPKL